jgi:hypothetical protein
VTKKSKELPIQVEIGAKAEASLQVKAEIPSSSMGRLVDALTDMISPFSEARGLRGDQIRLQRVDVAIEIARRARERIALEQAEPSPVPNKILIPLIEKSSNEEITDDVMISRWADLLASASISTGAHPRFVQILSELNREQVLLLEKIALNEYDQWQFPTKVFGDAFLDVRNDTLFNRQLYAIADMQFVSVDEVMDILQDVLNRPGCILYVALIQTADDDFVDVGMEYAPTASISLEICESLGLLKRVELLVDCNVSGKELEATVIYYHLTELGTTFVEHCAIQATKSLAAQQQKNMLIRPQNVEADAFPRSWRITYRSDKSNSLL